MNDQILVPIQSADRGVRLGRKFPFWHTQWEGITSNTYNEHLRAVKESFRPIMALEVPAERNIYTEVVLGDRATAKSTSPSEIWKNSDLEIVETTAQNTITVSGTKADYEALSKLLNSSSYQVAEATSSSTDLERDISREVMAVSSFKLKSVTAAKRMDRALIEYLDTLTEDVPQIDCFIELYADSKGTDYDDYAAIIVGVIGSGRLIKEDKAAFVSNKFYRARLTKSQIEVLLSSEQYLFIRVIRIVPQFVAQRSVASVDLSAATIARPETQQHFGVIDSGIDHRLVNDLVAQREKRIPSSATEDKSHGTFVASRALYGDRIYEIITSDTPTLTPVGKCIDIQVMYRDELTGESTVDTVDLIKHIREVIHRYQDVKIYNISISSREVSDDTYHSPLSELLDKLAREEDVLFICCTGNQSVFVGEILTEDDIFQNNIEDVRVLPPGDAISALTVGSRAQKSTVETISAEGHPSPFSRAGYVNGVIKKPELIANGGNYLKETIPSMDALEEKELSKIKYGVSGISTTGLLRDIGTSDAAPLVTREAVRAYDFIKNSNLGQRFDLTDNEANLTRALLVHSTAFNELPNITNEHVRKAYGFGVPLLSNLEHDGPDRVTIMYSDRINKNEKKHRLHILLPEFVLSTKLQFIFTLAFNPPVDKNFKQYNMMGITSSLNTVVPAVDTKGRPKYDPVDKICAGSEWNRYAISYSDKNSSITHFKVNKTRLNSRILEALIQLWVYPQYEQKTHANIRDMQQPYSLVMTIIDTESTGSLRNELMASNQFSLVNEQEIEIET